MTEEAPQSWAGKMLDHILTPGSATKRGTPMFLIINGLTIAVFVFWIVGIFATWDYYPDMRIHMVVFGFLLAGFTLSCNYVFAHLMADNSEEESKKST